MTIREEDRSVEVDGATLAGTLTFPDQRRSVAYDPPPGRDVLRPPGRGRRSEASRAGVPKRGMYKILAHGLAEVGIASYRFDRRGAGESTGEFGVERAQEVADAGAVWRWVRALPECNGKAAMLGHSAGAYVLCRVALEVGQPDAAVLQGALYRSIAELLRYNYSLVLDYIQLGEEQAAWVRDHSPKAYEDALMMDALVAAIEGGDAIVEAEVDGEPITRDLSSLRYDLDLPPEDQFRLLTAPTLVLHSSEDLNVPVEDAFDTVAALWAAGNRDVELRILPGGNHSFQFDAEDYETRVQEKITMENFARPFDPLYPAVVIDYLARRLT